jgi:IS1 family transposase
MLDRLMYTIIMNKLSNEKRTQIVHCLIEGSSLRATARMTGVAFNTVLKLLPEIGRACAEYQDRSLKNLTCKRVQCDEIWSFCYSKEKNVPEEFKGQFGFGDVWTWVALDADTKLVLSWKVGSRDALTAEKFMWDIAGRLAHRVQLTTDGYKTYLGAVERVFGCEIDYAMLVKLYSNPPADGQTRYSPGECCGARKETIQGTPERKHVSTSYVERQNLTMRMNNRRFTRLTNAFSKKLANHEAAIALHYMAYNFHKVHKTLRVTPAMEAGVTDHVWSVEEIVQLLDNPK